MNEMDMQDCIRQCWECRTECQKVFFEHCLGAGGAHLDREHVVLMMDCIAACQLAADMMTRSSPQHAAMCSACATLCEACAASCEAIGTETMRRCADICRSCAESCRMTSQLERAV